jgi:hypothetical protein
MWATLTPAAATVSPFTQSLCHIPSVAPKPFWKLARPSFPREAVANLLPIRVWDQDFDGHDFVILDEKHLARFAVAEWSWTAFQM